MCGIYGILRRGGGPAPDPALLPRMGGLMVHRGPDDEGAYNDGDIALGMRRLSIIDLSGGHQPIANEDGSLIVVCNGEIYNFRELRAELLARGHRFRTASDTEVLLHLYEEHGAGLVERLDGMFGFALWDRPRRRLLIGRDHLGVKPLYYLEDAGRLVFASEIKSILGLPGVAAEIDPAGLEHYLSLGYTPTPYTLFRGIRKLPPASLLIADESGVNVRSYWRIGDTADETRTERDWIDETRAEMESAVASQMVADVPVGAFLSGGLDSSAVVAMMARTTDHPIKTYSIGFEGGGADAFFNELPFARQVAEHVRTDHTEIVVRPDVASLLPKLLWHLDEPIADSAFITTYLVAELARRSVTVILSGVGGDEVFGGYRRYLGEHVVGRYRMLPGWLRHGVVGPLARLLPSDRHSRLANYGRLARAVVETADDPFEQRYRSYVEVFDRAAIRRLLRTPARAEDHAIDAAFAASGGADGLLRMLQVDSLTQLPNDLLALTDKMTMAASLECRVPLLRPRLVEMGARIPAGIKVKGGGLKHVMKAAVADLLPPSIVNRSKRGFGAPMGAWLRRELAPLTHTLLSRESIARRGLLDPDCVAATLAEHESKRADRTDHLIALLSLELWARIFIDGVAPGDVAAELKERAVA